MFSIRDVAIAGAILSLFAAPAYADDSVTETYGVRPAVQCPDVRRPPTLAEVVLLIKCRGDHDVDGNGQVGRVWNIQVRIGSPRPARYDDPNEGDVDASVDVYPIRGSKTDSTCSAISDYMQNNGHNCLEVDFAGEGTCYQTSFGDWKCVLDGTRVTYRGEMPPPR